MAFLRGAEGGSRMDRETIRQIAVEINDQCLAILKATDQLPLSDPMRQAANLRVQHYMEIIEFLKSKIGK